MTTTTTNSGFPLTLALPNGVTAQHVPGSGPPAYAVDGEPIEADVTIPDDLASWHWNGSFLCQQGERGLIWIASDTFGIPGIFEQARTIERVRAETRAKLPPRQMTLFEEVA